MEDAPGLVLAPKVAARDRYPLVTPNYCSPALGVPSCPYKAWRPVGLAGTGRFETFGEYQNYLPVAQGIEQVSLFV